MKTCTACGSEKPLSSYNKDSKNKDHLSNQCRDCSKTRSKEWYSTHKEEEREYRFPMRYGISLRDVKDMFASQKKLCTICNKKMVLGGKKGNSAHVDHDHKTGIVRGLICNNCNRLLGACFDDVWILHGAIRYLSGLPIKSTVVKWP